MVVLSSCSGITDDFRDLYKAFLVAGAESVVHANWQLESRFASEFTDEFLKNYGAMMVYKSMKLCGM